jgi:hypothetical protein
MEKFSTDLMQFMADNQKVKECVRQFDESMTTKANKGELITMERRLENAFITMK